jgi:hypothetical protein
MVLWRRFANTLLRVRHHASKTPMDKCVKRASLPCGGAGAVGAESQAARGEMKDHLRERVERGSELASLIFGKFYWSVGFAIPHHPILDSHTNRVTHNKRQS